MQENDLNLILDCLLYFIEKQAYFKNTKQTAAIFQQAGLSEELQQTFFEVWRLRGEKYVSVLKKQQSCVEHGLKDFNWVLNMPLDYSQAQKEQTAILDHQKVKEQLVFKKDIRAPQFEFTFELQGQSESELKQVRVNFSKTKLQGMFEELEKIQMKLD